jgi:hypothetical protein
MSIKPRQRTFLMDEVERRFIVAAENSVIREALIAGLQKINVAVEEIQPDLLQTCPLIGEVWVFLETQNDVLRLYQTAKYLYETYEKPGHAEIQMFVYATKDVIQDDDISAFWSIKSTPYVIVINYDPDELEDCIRGTLSFTMRVLSAPKDASPLS